MNNHKKTVVLGASDNPERYSYKAINDLRSHHHPVVAIGKKVGTVADVEIVKSAEGESNVDTVTLYLNPTHQQAYYEYILSLHPKRIIFNPGTENEELISLASKQGIQCIEACTLVMLRTGQY